jgi:beta-phosphoglucomutase-like phosphatase (HAD superfamily)
MLELLERMKEHFFTMGIVTASHREHFEIIHGLSGMLDRVDFAVVREDYPKAKPCPDCYLAGIERAGLAALDCIAVEDSPRGITAARAAGLECVFFTPGGVGADRDVGEVFARAGSAEELEMALGQWLRK